MYNIDTIKHIHIEPSNYCNSFCPQCPRYDNFGKLKKEIPLNHLSKEALQNIPIDKMKSLKNVTLCGALGDPLMNPHIDFIIDYFKDQKIHISTNASLRSNEWWKQLSSKKNVKTTFCIDGIDAETHTRYRRNTSFEKIIENARTYIDNGGVAQWQFIIFKHNQNQIDKAKRMSENFGFKKINFIYSDRFDYNDKWPVYVNERLEYNLERSTLTHNLSREVTGSEQGQFYLKGIMKEKIPEITCTWSKAKSIYVSANGYIYPCCMIGYIEGEPKWDNDIFKKCIANRYDLIDIKKYTLEEVINGPVYKNYFVESLKNKPHMICITSCHPKYGKEFIKNTYSVD